LATQTDGGNHYKSLSYKKAHTFITELRAANGTAGLALEFLILCATRTGETLKAEWSEIDRQTRTSEVPPEHRKGRLNKEKPLFVPLSNRAIEILDEVEKLTGGVGLIFPKPQGKRLSENAMLDVVKRLGYASPHGFRSTFQGWREDETSYPLELGEHAIGHAVPGVSGDYRDGSRMQRAGMATSRRRFTRCHGTTCPICRRSIHYPASDTSTPSLRIWAALTSPSSTTFRR
jgi:integrase